MSSSIESMTTRAPISRISAITSRPERRAELDVEHHDVGGQPAREPDGLSGIAALAHDVELAAVAEQSRHTRAHDRVVIDEEHANHVATIAVGSGTAATGPPGGGPVQRGHVG